ncbi:DUF6702 family protein [Aquimarina litoralis]|uniref:DUF6702 family protein n=1 Tax=Aquimarina litoralis TaxID=584605 RepID=UPI001C580939|nr:DUF6702 family protein [Aquimarina litoralis]MBW1295003.1 hypothetical protein [Aquimarina litoralis]
MLRLFVFIILCWTTNSLKAHPLKLSLCEIEYSSKKQKLTINLKLFLTDVNEAIVFDPNSNELAFCQPNESAKANQLLLNYLNRFFYVKVNNTLVELKIKNKNLKGEGDNTALWVYFEYNQSTPLKSLEVKNAVFTDLFFDQNNIVYVHVDEKSKSLMLDKKKSVHELKF